MECENCGSSNLEKEYVDEDYVKENHVTRYNRRRVCKDCDFDNYISTDSIELQDGTQVKEI